MKTMREEVFGYMQKKYKAKPEYLWAKFPEYAVIRHADNQKWFGLVMNISYDKNQQGSDEPYLHDWESLCRETSNTGNATSLLKILYELFTLTQPWKNYSGQDEKERYIANFKKLFEEVAEAFCHQQMTLDIRYGS